ncbi:MAG: heme-binding domain-containing protein [Chloroflexi bacterium]|nr:heme-binding domain-containing protein [Chloroflexota bacterium]
MTKTRIALPIAFLALALVVLVFAGTNFVAAPFWLVFRRSPGLDTAYTIAQAAAWIATVFLFAAAALVAIPTALGPGGWIRKALEGLPVYLLGLTAAAVIANLIGLATLGSVLDAQAPYKLSLATIWLGVSAALGTIAVVVAAARANLGRGIVKAATAATGIALVPAVILCLAILGAVYIVLTNPIGPTGGPPVGGLGVLAGLVTQVEVGGGVMAALTVIALVSLGLNVRSSRAAPAAASATGVPAVQVNYGREAVRAIVAGIGISVVVFAAIQVVPVSRDNPPAQGTMQWDSPQTEALVSRACTNCHGNATVWPWYSYFAPGSWITFVHVNSARQQWNVADLSKMTAIRKRRLVSTMVDAIRNGVMPPVDYQFLHPEARLSAEEREELIQGLQNSLK